MFLGPCACCVPNPRQCPAALGNEEVPACFGKPYSRDEHPRIGGPSSSRNDLTEQKEFLEEQSLHH